MTSETDILCPFCGEVFSTLVDCSEDDQTYIEDCYVCCRPIQFHVRCMDGELSNIDVNRGS